VVWVLTMELLGFRDALGISSAFGIWIAASAKAL
jgi:hypothetical protein